MLDSGASSHFLVTGAPVTNKKVAANPIAVTLPDGDQVHSTHTGNLNLPQLPAAARLCHIVPGLASYSLISVVKLCEAGCEVSFTKFGIGVEIKYRGRTVLTARKCRRTGLWMVPLDPYATQDTTNLPTNRNPNEHNSCNLMYPSYIQYAGNVTPTMLKAEVAMYHHQSMGSPPTSTFLQAIRAHPILFATFPGLTYELIHRHLPLSTATLKGHMIMYRQGLGTTARNNRQAVMDARQVIQDMCPTEHICSVVEDEIYCVAVIGDQNDNTIYSDLTGQFPVRSYEGKSYIFVAYVYKLNAVMLRPM